MRQWDAERFVRHFKDMVLEQEAQLAFFIGAGCSISSGIPGAATLVKRWIPKLHYQITGGRRSIEEWLVEELPEYTASNPAASYAAVMNQLFPNPPHRQREIEQVVAARDPGFGYAVLARLMTHPEAGPRCNLVLTTNFDDMVADALYLYTQHKPLVIVHDSLVGFVETGLSRPLVIKLHGDALLEPRNLQDETAELDAGVRRILAAQLSKRGLVFIGYGANDKSITTFLKSLPMGSLNWGVYWIHDEVPDNEFGEWLESRKDAIWIKHLRFDDLMALLRAEFDLDHPDKSRFDALNNAYYEALKTLSKEVAAQPQTATTAAVSRAVDRAVEEATDWWGVELAAQAHKDANPDKADEIYRDGLKDLPTSAPLLGNYALFLQTVRADMDAAESCYKRAIEADPNHANNLGNYANFLQTVRADMDAAEKYHKRAIEADPNHANNLGNYASFLQTVRADMEAAEKYYKRAIEADPNHANNLGNYANFLQNVRADADAAEGYYKRAMEADPNNLHLGNYAGFLLAHGHAEAGLPLLEVAVRHARKPEHATLFLECAFYRLAHGPADQRSAAVAEIRRLLDEGVRSPGWNLSANVERARAEAHPHADFLQALAAVISDGADAASLEEFEIWHSPS